MYHLGLPSPVLDFVDVNPGDYNLQLCRLWVPTCLLFLPLSAFLASRTLSPIFGASNLFVVAISLMLLLFSCMLLSDTGSLVKASHQLAGIGVIVNHTVILQDLFENLIYRESRDSTEYQIEWGIPNCFMHGDIVGKIQRLFLFCPMLFRCQWLRT